MKILIINTEYLPIPAIKGGAVENLVETYLLYNEKNKNHEITVFSSNKTNEQIDTSYYKKTEFRYIEQKSIMCKMYDLFSKIMDKFFNIYIGNSYINKIINYIKKNIKEYDKIIVENSGLYAIRLRKALKKSNITLHVHNDYLNKKTKYSKEILASCNEIWAVSKFIKNRIDEISSGNSNCKVLYNGIDRESFLNVEFDENLYKKYNNEKDFLFLYVGRIMPEKGVLELIKAFKDFNKNNPYTKLLIVGGLKNNSKELNEYWKVLKEETKSLKNKIIFTGTIEYKELKKYYKIADAQIVPSRWNEAFGLIVAEGMTMGLPLIVSNTGGLPEVVDDAAIIVDKKNMVSEIKDAMQKIYNDEKLREKLIEIGKKRSLMFSKSVFCDNFENLINNVKEI